MGRGSALVAALALTWLSGGPQRGDRTHDIGLHAYAALGLNF